MGHDFDWIQYLTAILQITGQQLIATLLPAVAAASAVHVSSVIVHNTARRALSDRAYTYSLSMVGTTVHELSHALTASLFGCHITEMKLFDPSPTAPVRGYVQYSYNGNSAIQRLGQLVIGIAPLLFGSVILMLLGWWLIGADIFAPWGVLLGAQVDGAQLMQAASQHAASWVAALNPEAWMTATTMLWRTLSAEATNPSLYLFLLVAAAIGSGMHVSSTDAKTLFTGLVTLAGAALLLNLFLIWALPDLVVTIYSAFARLLWPATAMMAITAILNLSIALMLLPLTLGRSATRRGVSAVSN